jgi:hypothetical protein
MHYICVCVCMAYILYCAHLQSVSMYVCMKAGHVHLMSMYLQMKLSVVWRSCDLHMYVCIYADLQCKTMRMYICMHVCVCMCVCMYECMCVSALHTGIQLSLLVRN